MSPTHYLPIAAHWERIYRDSRADELGWGHIAQGGKGRPVYCCHIEVAEKRWIYPPSRPNGSGIPPSARSR